MRMLVLILALVSPLPALALSCMAPSVTRSFDRFAAAEEIYVVVKGRVTFDARLLPQGMQADRDPPQMTRVPAVLVGKSLNKNGFRLPFEQDVTLEVTCLGPWCGGVKNGEDLLAFLRKTDAGYALAITPCGGSAFGAPKLAQLKQVAQCYRDGSCETP